MKQKVNYLLIEDVRIHLEMLHINLYRTTIVARARRFKLIFMMMCSTLVCIL